MGSDQGLTDAQLETLAANDVDRSLFDERLLAALDYAEEMTVSDVTDEGFSRVRPHFSDDELVELTAVIAWENSSARFNRALRVPSQGLWNR
ncbi:MAG: carboxymuconolactone decarboxylase family protein [Acidimicrobiales bacterium]